MSDERAQKLGIMETPIDRLSALPDSIIIHILSLLGNDVKEAAVTSVLSKRWQFIWSEMPRLHFFNSSLEIEKKRDFVSWVGRTLLLRSSGTHLETFQIEFYNHECFASDLNAFIRFAVRSKAKELTLSLCSSELYKLPQVLYSDSSLRYLNVLQCVLAPRGTIEWRSMTHLHIECAYLDEHVIHKVISGCPVLRTLDLMLCWGFERLDLDSESLDMLMLLHSDGENSVAPLLEISAPYLRNLNIGFNPMKRNMQLTNVPSLINVHISFESFDDFGDSVEVLNNTMELFEKVRHVKDLKLNGYCVEVLSELVVQGGRLPQSRRHFLGLDISRDEDCIPGILGLLESSPNLDTLLIECCLCYQESDWPWGPIARDDLVCDLLNLKTVRLFNYADPNLGGEPMLTMARILLKRAPALELMLIDAQDNLVKFPSEFAKISRTVLSYPKSSEKAEIVLRL